MGFSVILKSELVMLSFLAMGYALAKFKLAEADHGKSLSSFLVYFITPGMIISSFQSMEYNARDALKLLWFFLVSLIAQVLMFLILIAVLKNRLNDGKYRIFTIGSFLGNVGFFGQPLISALIPTEPIVSGYCMLFATSMNLLIFTVGEFMITRDRKYISIRRTVINPTVLSVFVAVPLYLMNIKLPSEIQSVLLTLRAMAAPICMLILGLRLASMKLKEVFTEPFAYLVSAMKLLVFPLFAYALVYFLPWFDSTFKTSVLIISGTPCAAVIQSLSELHGSEQKNAAYTVLISSILCAVTLPLLALILL